MASLLYFDNVFFISFATFLSNPDVDIVTLPASSTASCIATPLSLKIFAISLCAFALFFPYDFKPNVISPEEDNSSASIFISAIALSFLSMVFCRSLILSLYSSI